MSKHIVAITACAAGIAHTYMAAESLEQAGKTRGFCTCRNTGVH